MHDVLVFGRPADVLGRGQCFTPHHNLWEDIRFTVMYVNQMKYTNLALLK